MHQFTQRSGMLGRSSAVRQDNCCHLCGRDDCCFFGGSLDDLPKPASGQLPEREQARSGELDVLVYGAECDHIQR